VCNKPKEHGDKAKRSSSPHTSTPLPHRKEVNNEEFLPPNSIEDDVKEIMFMA
jgi:hypothetical protein